MTIGGSGPPRADHVIRLVSELDRRAEPPETLPTARRMGTGGRAVGVVLLLIGTAVAASLIAVLWIADSPGWWFSALFTVFIGGLCLAAWLVFAGSVQLAGQERRAAARWQELHPRVVGLDGAITDREVSLAEDGSVSRFRLQVALDTGGRVVATWQPERSSIQLLQPQVPGLGAPVRVWRAPTATTEEPLVVDVADPTATPRRGEPA